MVVGLKVPKSVETIKGIRLSAVDASIYAKPRLDLVLIEIAEGSVISAVFTKNKFCAAPVYIAKEHLTQANPKYLLINAGNANAGTGQQGLDNASKLCVSLANITGCDKKQVLPFSTGIIGEQLPVSNIEKKLQYLFENLSDNEWHNVAQAIMTTDTIPKLVSKLITIDDTEVRITGVAKGSGMIKPDMATMLSFVATDANIAPELLNKILNNIIDKSFNRITVDGDTSTNDACILIATRQADNKKIESYESEQCAELESALIDVFCLLAQAIIRDGEGASKFIEIEVRDGKSAEDCLSVAYSIAESPLVKTAFTASDPNWGRILAAVGKADTDTIEISKVSIFLDDLCIVNQGEPHEDYTEKAGKKIMLQDEIKISVCLGMGEQKETIWTTDLSHEYININAEYRT